MNGIGDGNQFQLLTSGEWKLLRKRAFSRHFFWADFGLSQK